jgi:hypothetical protein
MLESVCIKTFGRSDLKTDQTFDAGIWCHASSLRCRKARMWFSQVGHVTYDIPTFVFLERGLYSMYYKSQVQW